MMTSMRPPATFTPVSLLREVYCKVGGEPIIPEAMGEQRGGGEEGIGSPRIETLRDKRCEFKVGEKKTLPDPFPVAWRPAHNQAIKWKIGERISLSN